MYKQTTTVEPQEGIVSTLPLVGHRWVDFFGISLVAEFRFFQDSTSYTRRHTSARQNPTTDRLLTKDRQILHMEVLHQGDFEVRVRG